MESDCYCGNGAGVGAGERATVGIRAKRTDLCEEAKYGLKGYVIRRNGWYLLSKWRDNPPRLVAEADTPRPCIWGERIYDAMVFVDRRNAERAAKQIGDKCEVVEVEVE